MIDDMRARVADATGKGLTSIFDGARDSVRVLRMGAYAAHRVFEASVLPSVDAAVGMQRHVADGLVGVLRGDRKLTEVVTDVTDRVHSGLRFSALALTVGRDLFGSATFPGEVEIARDGNYRVVYIPPAPDVPEAPRAVFHGAGGIPYGDRLFRGLPEANFFGVFAKRGIPLYAMELIGDRHVADPRNTTIDSLIATYDRLTAAAFEHNGRRQMVLEGYCGHGLQAWAFVAAHPDRADERFVGFANFVAPVDARECTTVGELSQMCPESLMNSFLEGFHRLGGNVPGWSLQSSLDMGLKNLFPKTPFGAFSAGWNQPAWKSPKTAADLTPEQRMQIIGSYWISPINCDRWALPVDLVRYAAAVFTKGIGNDGTIPWTWQGRTLSIGDVAKRTKLKVLGVYAGRDLIVPDRTAYCLKGIFGDRYEHIVHPNAGHVSYVFSPRLWDRSYKGRLDPDPLDRMMAM